MSALRIDRQFLILFVIVAAIFLGASFFYYHKSVQPDRSISWVDFRVYYYAGLNIEAGVDIYDTSCQEFCYKYSPIFALVMSTIKFTTVQPADALMAWYIILFISFTVSMYLIKEILFYPRPRPGMNLVSFIPFLYVFRYLVVVNFLKSYLPTHWPLWVRACDLVLYILPVFFLPGLVFISKKKEGAPYLKVMLLMLLFVSSFLLLNIDRAQINIVILFLLLLFAYNIMMGRDITAGLYLGVAIILKLTPAIFLVYLFIKRRFKALVSTIASFAVLLFIPFFKIGPNRNIELIAGWVGALKATFPQEYLQYKNQSIMAMLSRLCSRNSDVAVIRLDDLSLTILVGAIYAVFFLALAYFTIKTPRKTGGGGVAADLSLFFIAMTMLTPVGTKAAFICLALPVAMLIKEAFDRGLKDNVINAGLITATLLCLLSLPDLTGGLSLALHKYSVLALVALALFFTSLYVKFSSPARP